MREAGNSAHPNAAADFFNDGKLDLVGTASLITHVDLLFGMGQGHFHYAQRIVVTDFLSRLAVATGDFNGDGEADIAVANGLGKITVRLTQGP
jgi:hypothetical protein